MSLINNMKKIHIFATGGTICSAGKPGETSIYDTFECSVNDMLRESLHIEELAEISGEQICNCLSDNITFCEWIKIADRIEELSLRGIDGFVITHGTNTLEECAFFLNLVVKTKKPVVITGAMRPFTANSADGAQNLYQAVALAANSHAYGQGVLVAFADAIFHGRDIQKINCYRTDAFSEKDFGCMGNIVDNRVYLNNQSCYPHTVETEFETSLLKKGIPRVPIIYFCADMDVAVLDALYKEAQGFVIAGAGFGAVSTLWEEKIKKYCADGFPVVRTSRVANGIVEQNDYDEKLGTIAGKDLNPQKARILLLLALSKKYTRKQMIDVFQRY